MQPEQDWPTSLVLALALWHLASPCPTSISLSHPYLPVPPISPCPTHISLSHPYLPVPPISPCLTHLLLSHPHLPVPPTSPHLPLSHPPPPTSPCLTHLPPPPPVSPISPCPTHLNLSHLSTDAELVCMQRPSFLRSAQYDIQKCTRVFKRLLRYLCMVIPVPCRVYFVTVEYYATACLFLVYM